MLHDKVKYPKYTSIKKFVYMVYPNVVTWATASIIFSVAILTDPKSLLHLFLLGHFPWICMDCLYLLLIGWV